MNPLETVLQKTANYHFINGIGSHYKYIGVVSEERPVVFIMVVTPYNYTTTNNITI